MNAILPAIADEFWSLAGWTMIRFLWLGAIVAAFAFAGRTVLRTAAPNVRYTFALVCLALITSMPLVAAWLYDPTSSGRAQLAAEPSPSGRGQGEGALSTSMNTTLPSSANSKIQSPTPPLIELHTPSSEGATTAANPNSPPLKGGARGGIPINASPPPTLNSQPSTFNPLAPRASLLTPLISYLPWLWLIGTPLTFALLFTGLIGTHRLSRASTPITTGPIADALGHLTTSLRITRRVTVAVCERVAAPVLIGIVRPMILLPPAALTGWSPDEIEMVLLHELAHIRRYDNVVNLAQRIIESLLFFHPAVWLISTWVRREREACCDAAVVARTQQPHAYAELLLNIAAHLSEPGHYFGDYDTSEPGRPRPRPFPLPRGRGRPGSLPVSSPMAAGPLRTRIRHILQLEDDPMLITPKSLAITLATLLAAATLAFVYLPKIGQAEQPTTEGTETTANESSKRLIEGASSAPVNIASPKHEPEATSDQKVFASFPDSNTVDQDDVLRAIESAKKKHLHLDVRRRDGQFELIVVPAPSEKNWPAILGDPPRKERVIAEKAWRRLGLKLLPMPEVEMTYRMAKGKHVGILVLGGNVPAGLPLPSILTTVGRDSVQSFDQLLIWLESEQAKSTGDVKCRAIFDDDGSAKEYLIDAQPMTPDDGPVAGLDWYGKPIGPDSTRDWSGNRIAEDEPAIDDWPKGVVFPSPKESNISIAAWRQLRIKVVPASEGERAAEGGHAIKVVGGLATNRDVKDPVFLLSLNDHETKTFDELAAALEKVKGQTLVIAKYVTTGSLGPV